MWQRWFIRDQLLHLLDREYSLVSAFHKKKNRRSNANWLFCLVSFLLFLFKDINRYHIEKTTLLPLPSYNPTHFDAKNIYLRQFFFHDRWGWNKPDSVMWWVIKDLNVLMYAWFYPLLKTFVAKLTFSFISF